MKNNLDWTELDLEALPADFIPRTSYQPECEASKYSGDYGSWASAVGNPAPVRSHYRIAWRRMAGISGVRSLNVCVIVPGTAHVHPVYSAAVAGIEVNADLLPIAGVLASLVSDFLIKVSGSGEVNFNVLGQLPTIRKESAAWSQLGDRAARLICLTSEYAPLFAAWSGTPWTADSCERSALGRRKLSIEIDALSALALGISINELCTIYRTQFPVLIGYEQNDLYDANGRKVPGDMNRLYQKIGENLTVEDRSWRHPQSGVEYVFEFPFQGLDREEDMRKAYAHFSSMLGEKS
jgi:hypothetical protein